MRVSTMICALSLTALLGGCAVPPSGDDMARLPVVTFGETAPSTDFVLHYKAGQPLPVSASVTGTFLDRTAQQTLTVTTKRDIWVYKQWASLDGKSWVKGTDLVSGVFAITLPGQKTGNEPGGLAARFDAK